MASARDIGGHVKVRPILRPAGAITSSRSSAWRSGPGAAGSRAGGPGYGPESLEDPRILEDSEHQEAIDTIRNQAETKAKQIFQIIQGATDKNENLQLSVLTDAFLAKMILDYTGTFDNIGDVTGQAIQQHLENIQDPNDYLTNQNPQDTNLAPDSMDYPDNDPSDPFGQGHGVY